MTMVEMPRRKTAALNSLFSASPSRAKTLSSCPSSKRTTVPNTRNNNNNNNSSNNLTHIGGSACKRWSTAFFSIVAKVFAGRTKGKWCTVWKHILRSSLLSNSRLESGKNEEVIQTVPLFSFSSRLVSGGTSQVRTVPPPCIFRIEISVGN